MREKITIEQFEQLKSKYSDTFDEIAKYYNDHRLDENFDDNAFNNMIDKRTDILKELLSYDLSDISFEKWKGFRLYDIADFSGTKANIDFNYIEYFGGSNFKGCNVRNLEAARLYLNPDSFDEDVVQNNSLLFLSNLFSEEFKKKYYQRQLIYSDFINLSKEQIQELENKDVTPHLLDNHKHYRVIESLGIEKATELYFSSLENYELLNSTIGNISIRISSSDDDSFSYDSFIEQLKKTDVADIKKLCFSFIRSKIASGELFQINVESLPEIFVKENGDILLTDESIPDDLRQKYYTKSLTMSDVLQNIDLFENIEIENYLIYSSDNIRKTLGKGNFIKLIKKYPDVFQHIFENDDFFSWYNFTSFFSEKMDAEKNFVQAVKKFVLKREDMDNIVVRENGQVHFNIPEWLRSMNFKFIEKINNMSDLLQYDESTFILDEAQQKTIDMMNIDNIKKIEQDLGFFSHIESNRSGNMQMFNAMANYIHRGFYSEKRTGIDYKNGTLTYEEFLDNVAKTLDNMRQHNFFPDYPNYDWIQGEFRKKYSEIFMDINAPQELKKAFYNNRITPEFLYLHPEYAPYLVNKKLDNTINADIHLTSLAPLSYNPDNTETVNFITEYVALYGNKKMLDLILKYGPLFSNMVISNINNEIQNEKIIEKSIRDSIYHNIKHGNINYSYLLKVSEFVSEHPDIFVDFDLLKNISQEERDRLSKAFYTRNLAFDDIQKYPELVYLLMDKDLHNAFGYGDKSLQGRYIVIRSKDTKMMDLIAAIGNENFLKLCSIYGRYLNGIEKYLDENSIIDLNFNQLSHMIQEIIVKGSILGNIDYQPGDAPDFLRNSHPELFLSDDAPEELKNHFYRKTSNYGINFEFLSKHKEFLPYLEGKSIKTALLRIPYLRSQMMEFFQLFGEEKAVKLGINKAKTVHEMFRANKVKIMKQWYDKTGGRFIPDFVVMQNFNIEEADKFLTAGVNWSNLMRIKSFTNNNDSKDVLLKLAYCFGVFDQDQRGYKKLVDLLTGIPRHIDSEHKFEMESIASLEETGKMLKDSIFESPQGYNEYIELRETLKKEGFEINEDEEIFSKIYRKNDDGSYTLTINPQSYPKASQLIRNILEIYPSFPILNPRMAHHYLGGISLQYDPDFREFFLDNLDTILANDKYLASITPIQRRFKEIKTLYSNVPLTLDLAYSFIQDNRYENVNVGNERVMQAAAINNYEQGDFETLQQIYNYAKQRTFSSIPRIEGSNDKYVYEILRLDDPLAMAIGNLTTCCQRLHEPGCQCMEHSMVDKNGRLFCVHDKNGEVIAQSWVWRNGDVLCFDNIEVPDQQMWNHGIPRGKEDAGIRNEFTDEILEIYKKAAREIIKKDEEVYRELLEKGQITQEQFDGLRIGKITIGLGYSNIKGSFVTLKRDSEKVRPLPFDPPVDIGGYFYTNDSTTQFILEERDNRKKNNGDALLVHNDTYIEYDDTNFNKKLLLTLEKLELVTKNESFVLDDLTERNIDSRYLVTDIARKYDLNSQTTKIVMNPNFAIIYDVNGNKITIADLLFNMKIDNGPQQMNIENTVIMQIRLALDQITKGKDVDISNLDDNQKNIYYKALGLKDEIDKERGVSNAR